MSRGYVMMGDGGVNPILEGWQTFTPTVTLVGGSGNTVPQYTTNNGRYTRMCSAVMCEVLLDGDGGNEGAGTGQINVALPIAGGASKIDGNMGFIVGQAVNGSNDRIISGIIDQSATTIKLYYFSAINTSATLTGADQNNTSRAIKLSFWYEID